MKEGAGEDPFASSDDQASGSDAATYRGAETAADTAVETTGETSAEPSSDDEAAATQSSGRSSMRIPYKFRRDGVQDGRERVPLFLQSDTKSGERDAQRELEDRFDDDVSLTDLREALMKTGLEHLDEVEQHLEEWGYGMTFED